MSSDWLSLCQLVRKDKLCIVYTYIPPRLPKDQPAKKFSLQFCPEYKAGKEKDEVVRREREREIHTQEGRAGKGEAELVSDRFEWLDLVREIENKLSEFYAN